jgi:hypothetical protein
MIQIDYCLKPSDLLGELDTFWDLSGQKICLIRDHYAHTQGSPVFTVAGAYTTRGWTEWTQGFEFGSAILQFDATGDEEALEYGRSMTVGKMAPHVSHFGVHDHGFNNVSTYGNLLRLMQEGRLPQDIWERRFYELALKISGAAQAHRWTSLPEDDAGFIYSFNGPHSLFVDTIRSCRALMVSWLLKHQFMAEGDKSVSILKRALQHGLATAKYSIYYNEGRDSYDAWGRTAHESVFNCNDGAYRCPNSQQGYTGLSTWTRGLAWAMCGFPEELELLETLKQDDLSEQDNVDLESMKETFLKAARATCDFYLANTPTDGIPYWDAGAPGLVYLGDYLDRPSDPYNEHEPIDSSAAAIGAQGLLRLGKYLGNEVGQDGHDYWQAGLTVLQTLLSEPYLSTARQHQGLILHSIYHRPNGWDHVPQGSKIPNGESSMWGDYHARELALYVQRVAKNEPYYRFFDCVSS